MSEKLTNLGLNFADVNGQLCLRNKDGIPVEIDESDERFDDVVTGLCEFVDSELSSLGITASEKHFVSASGNKTIVILNLTDSPHPAIFSSSACLIRDLGAGTLLSLTKACVAVGMKVFLGKFQGAAELTAALGSSGCLSSGGDMQMCAVGNVVKLLPWLSQQQVIDDIFPKLRLAVIGSMHTADQISPGPVGNFFNSNVQNWAKSTKALGTKLDPQGCTVVSSGTDDEDLVVHHSVKSVLDFLSGTTTPNAALPSNSSSSPPLDTAGPGMGNFLQALQGQKKKEDPNKPPSAEIADRLKKGQACKDEGTAAFKEGNYKRASFKWKTALRMYLGGLGTHSKKDGDPTMALVSMKMKKETPNGAQTNEADELILALNLNLAQVSLKLERWDQALDFCNDALILDTTNTKAFYRRGKAWFNKHDLDRAKADWEQVEKTDPKAVAAEMKQLKKAYEKIHDKEKTMFKAMFGK